PGGRGCARRERRRAPAKRRAPARTLLLANVLATLRNGWIAPPASPPARSCDRILLRPRLPETPHPEATRRGSRPCQQRQTPARRMGWFRIREVFRRS